MASPPPHMRVFLSADLVGSTQLKNLRNQQELAENYDLRFGVIEKLRAQEQNFQLDNNAAQKAVLALLEIERDDFDWSTVIQTFYRDFHSDFSAALNRVSAECDKIAGSCNPWKAIGDELIYEIIVTSRRHLYWIVTAFLQALRTYDRRLSKDGDNRHGLRLKGAAWVAGFPVRNRIVTLPGLGTEDFLGPDIDTGFRIARFTSPGMLAVTVELVELLSETRHLEPFVGTVVGWEVLKGVWANHHYPITWLDLPRRSREENEEFQAKEFDQWQILDCPLSKNWSENVGTLQDADNLVKGFKELRKRLPPRLGIVDPYIVGDPDTADVVPPEHQKIAELQRMVDLYQIELSPDSPETEVATAGREISQQDMDTLLSGIFDDMIDDEPTPEGPAP